MKTLNEKESDDDTPKVGVARRGQTYATLAPLVVALSHVHTAGGFPSATRRHPTHVASSTVTQNPRESNACTVYCKQSRLELLSIQHR